MSTNGKSVLHYWTTGMYGFVNERIKAYESLGVNGVIGHSHDASP